MNKIETISGYLIERCGIREATPGQKCRCPVCGFDLFSIKSNDEVGKCFNTRCQKTISVGYLRNIYG